MEDLNIPIFAQAKVEYTKQLIEILYPHMYDGIKSIYDESKIIYSTKTTTPILLLFRELLEKVPIWNGEIIDSECSRIINNSKCDWIDDLITAVFISHTKILTSIGPNQSFQKINVTIPKTSSFIHKSYINVARELWKNPYLFNEQVPGHEYQRNSKEIENIIRICIENTIRHLLPIKEILKEHLDSQESDNLMNQKDEIKKLLREELQNLKPITDEEEDKNEEDKEEDKNEDEEEDKNEEDKEEDKNEDKEEDKNEDKEEDKNEDKEEDKNEENKEEDKNEENKEEDKNEDKEEDKNEVEVSDSPKTIEEAREVISDLINDIENSNSMDTGPTIEEVDGKPTLYVSSNNDDPTEAQVEKQCSDIVVNDITIPVDVDGDEKKEDKVGQEVKYDNVELIQETNEENKDDRMKKLFTNMEKINKNDEINVVKDNQIKEKTDDIKDDSQNTFNVPNYSLNNLYPTMKVEDPPKVVDPPKQPEPEPEPEIKIEEQKTNELPKIDELKEVKDESKKVESPRKEIVTIENDNDIDETSTLVNFFNDIKQIAEDKGIKVDTEQNKNFTLFEDASEVEK